ncbi:MAG: cation diffusion facilitator family transporter [Alphaproteobacteria bacterium]|nr:cation diffusion facilitator family transporter [Alphaproteobacteria bacterium]
MTAEALTNIDKNDRDRVARLMRLATYASVSTALVLIAAKIVAWILTDSIAMLSSLIDSLLDSVTSIFNLFAVRHALRPADEEHRFGHGKLEPLSGLVQSAFIVGSGILLLIEAGNRALFPHPVSYAYVGVGVSIFAIVVTIVLVRFQAYVIRRSRSVAIGADALHYKGDLFINLGVIGSLIASTTLGFYWIDPLVGAAVGLFLMFNALRIGRSSLDMLMDRELPDEDRSKIMALALSHPKVLSVHELKTRASGRDSFIQLHLEMDGNMTLTESHDIADTVEAEIQTAFPEAEVIIHQDPAGLEEDHPDY